MAKILMKGNEAIGEAAIRAGCLNFFGYPITPQNEIPEYLSRRLPEVGGLYVQSESEVATVNMLFGTAGVGVRVMTSSSSPGISLMSEGISYLAGAELPVVIVNMMRSGPGLAGILPAQSDYLQATKGMGHGDFELIVLAPSSVQESVDLTILAFELAEKYRTPVILLGDGMIGQMMEPVEFPDVEVGPPLKADDWALTGCKGREPRLVTSLYLDPVELNEQNIKRFKRFEIVRQNEIRYETYNCDEPYKILITAFGVTARVCKSAIDQLKEEGISVGLFRPIVINPFPENELKTFIDKAERVLDVEMNMGQMLLDVRLSAQGSIPIDFLGKTGGLTPSIEDVITKVKEGLAINEEESR
ncbi:MAG: 3-methyl-2-oxobutanoate dehydrogenase subunit VorB [Deltaproteobacteria bacterium]|nr:3-methyl-2-oxobutanoate dehydrogenase subunit VorB [Deltaproteobacteria bacterium]